MAQSEYSVKKITTLEANTEAADNDLLVVGNNGTAIMKKLTFANLANSIRDKLKNLTFTGTGGLNTTSKTLPGAINELNTKMSLTDVQNVTFQNAGTRSLIWLYTNEAKTEGYRIDVDGTNKIIQYSTLPISGSSTIGTVYMRTGWKTLWTGSITANGSATLSGTADLYYVRTANSAGDSTTIGGFFLPALGGSNAFYMPIMLGTTSTYVRVQINGTAFSVLSVGNTGVYVKAIFGIIQ